jgi:CRP/FNR family transcriptional regulator, cyclic AMP receptor protein
VPSLPKIQHAASDAPQCETCPHNSRCAFANLRLSGITAHYGVGIEVVHQGAPVLGMHVVCNGLVAVSESYSHRKESLLYILKGGSVLGPTDYFLDLPRYHVSGLTLTDCTIAFFPRTAVGPYLDENGAQATRLLSQISRQLRLLKERFIMLDAASAHDRLILALLWLADLNASSPDEPTRTIPFAMDRTMLSHLIGVRPETVTRMMSQLQKSGVLSYSKGHLVVADREKLKGMLSDEIDESLILSSLSLLP